MLSFPLLLGCSVKIVMKVFRQIRRDLCPFLFWHAGADFKCGFPNRFREQDRLVCFHGLDGERLHKRNAFYLPAWHKLRAAPESKLADIIFSSHR